MNQQKVEEVVKDIIELWNKKYHDKRKKAVCKLKMSKWFLPPNTYNYLANIMGEKTIPCPDDLVEEDDILKQAQKIIGGKIIKNG